MKKLLAALVALVAINASAYDVTNTVTIVSNIYNRISEEHWITNNIKNTHTNYHYTNNVYTVSNVTLLVSQTNVHTTATYDMGRSMLSIMSNDVNSAKASIRSTADEAAGSASNASYSASSAISSAASAQNTLNNVNTRGAEIINGMNAKQNWFDQNYGKMITNHNIYVAEDQVARAGVAQNAADIASLEGRVGDNIQQLTTRMGAAEGNISSLGSRMGTAEGNITTLGTRIGTAEGNITTLGTRISTAEGEISALKPMLGVATNYVISTDDSAVPEAVFELGYKNNPQNVVIGYVKIRRGFNESSDHINYTTGYSYAVAQPNVNLFSSYNNSWWFSPNYEQYRYFNIVLMDQGGYYIDARWNGYTYNGDPYNFPMTEAGNVTGNWRGTSGRTLYCKMISNTINMRTDLKYIQGTFVYDKDGNKVDELIFKSEVSNDTQRLEAHIRTADANFNDIFARLRVLEASISHKNYIYDFKRSGTQLGTLTVNTDNPTVTADTSEYTEYSYPYTTTWSQSSTTASPSVTSCKKRIYKNGITNPQTMVTFSMSSGVQITMNSTTTYNSIKSYFTDSVQFTTYNPQYTFILSFNKTSD